MKEDFISFSELKNNSTFQKLASNYFLTTENIPIIQKVQKETCGFHYSYNEDELTLTQLQRILGNGGKFTYLPLPLVKENPPCSNSKNYRASNI